MTNSNGSKPFEAEPGNGQATRSSSASSISGSLQQSTRRNYCEILRSSSWLAGPASQERPTALQCCCSGRVSGTEDSTLSCWLQLSANPRSSSEKLLDFFQDCRNTWRCSRSRQRSSSTTEAESKPSRT